MLGTHISGFQHLGVPVTDLARSKAFYSRLGFHEVMATALPSPEGEIQVSMMEIAGFILEMYQLPGAAGAEIGTRNHGHIDHVALDVDDIRVVFDTVKAAGLPPLEDEPVFLPFWEKGVYYFNIQGPDGEKVEFNQRVK
ncbi:MAG: VOC family protein [Anaerolineae bacterium]